MSPKKEETKAHTETKSPTKTDTSTTGNKTRTGGSNPGGASTGGAGTITITGSSHVNISGVGGKTDSKNHGGMDPGDKQPDESSDEPDKKNDMGKDGFKKLSMSEGKSHTHVMDKDDPKVG